MMDMGRPLTYPWVVDHERVLDLLERYIERETQALGGKGAYLPQLAYVWKMNPIGGWEKVAEGACRERSTAPKKHDIVDEFGFYFRSVLDEREQALVILAHISTEEEWRILRASWAGSLLRPRQILKRAWTILSRGWRKREASYSRRGV